MKNLFFESKTVINFDAPVVDHHFLLRCMPPSFPGQRIVTSMLQLSPAVPYTISTDGFGNLNQTGCIKFPHKEFVYHVRGVAQISEEEIRPERLRPIYKHPSKHTHMNADMIEFFHGLNLKGTERERALALAEAVYNYMTYESGITHTGTLASEAFNMKKGVCQDYSHIYIALSRFGGIPARYANGLPLGSGASHAWVEAYVDGRWLGIDPTRNRLVGEDYVRFGIGRDFADCALERGVLFGSANQIQQIDTKVLEQ